MAGITRREAIGIAIAGTTVAAVGPYSAFAEEHQDAAAKLLRTMEEFRTRIPPAEIDEFEGATCEAIRPYTYDHLGRVGRRLGVKSRAEGLVLLTYIKDTDCRVRIIAIEAILNLVNAFPEGMNASALIDVKSDAHQVMVLRFVKLIDKLPA